MSVDHDYEFHRATWVAFTRFVTIGSIAVALLLTGMAIGLL